jgi:hypothetical protein
VPGCCLLVPPGHRLQLVFAAGVATAAVVGEPTDSGLLVPPFLLLSRLRLTPCPAADAPLLPPAACTFPLPAVHVVLWALPFLLPFLAPLPTVAALPLTGDTVAGGLLLLQNQPAFCCWGVLPLWSFPLRPWLLCIPLLPLECPFPLAAAEEAAPAPTPLLGRAAVEALPSALICCWSISWH